MSYFHIPNYHASHVAYCVEKALAHIRHENNPNINLEVITPHHERWAMSMRQAFEFLRAAAGRHYTHSTLMKVLDFADNYGFRTDDDSPKPCLLRAVVESSYDPDTEVKRGGLLGVLVQMNDGNRRAVLAVAEQFRRKGVGSALLDLHTRAIGSPNFWVARGNVGAQQFLLQRGLVVQQMNGRGALMYGRDEDGGQE